MKNRLSPSEKREKRLRHNCIVSGSFLTVLGLVLAIAAFSISESDGTALGVLLIAVLAFGLGIYQFNAFRIMKKKEADADDPESSEFSRILVRQSKAQEKIRKRALKENHRLYDELFKAEIPELTLLLFIAAMLVIYIWLSFENLAVVLCIIAAAVIFAAALLLKIPYKKFRKYAEENGIDFEDVEKDFSNAEVYIRMSTLIGIGDRYTIFNGGKHHYIIPNSTVIGIEPVYEVIDNYNNGIYSGSIRRCYVIICTSNGWKFTGACEEFAEELIIQAYQKRQMYLHNDFKLINQENYPAYFSL